MQRIPVRSAVNPNPNNGVPAPRQRLDVKFVGTGSEYFRIWIVNLLLILLTLGIYYPYAKVRKQQYFLGATEVGGHPLSFHAQPSKMLRGYLLVAVLFAVYVVARRSSEAAGLAAFLIVAAVWPALWHSSLRFRLANTGWRGLRFRFTVSLPGAYKVLMPAAALALIVVILAYAFAPEMVPTDSPGAQEVAKPEAHRPELPWVSFLPLLMVAFVPRLLWWLRRYQQSHLALAGEQSRFSAGLRSYYAVFGFALAVTVLIAVLLGVLIAVVFPVVFSQVGGGVGGRGRTGAGFAMFAATAVLAVSYVAVTSFVGSLVRARLQNLVWSSTRSPHLVFHSQLGVGALTRLSFKNWLLIVLTLGLYWPFAAVATAKLRLEAVQVLSDISPDVLVSALTQRDEPAAGDAAGDLFGIDIGP